MEPTLHRNHGMLAEGDPCEIVVLRYRLRSLPASRSGHNGSGDPEGALRRHLELLDRWGITLITLSDCRLFLKGELHLPRRPLILTFDDGPSEILPILRTVFRELGGRALLFVLSGDGDTPDAGPMSIHGARRDDLVALAETGVEIGSLTCTGRSLPSLPPDMAAQELSRSKAILEETLDVCVHSCAYPRDVVTPEIKTMVIKAGYDFAVGGVDGSMVFGTDLYEIRRQTIATTTGALGLAVRVFGPHERIQRMRQKSLARLSLAPRALRIPVNS